MSDYKYLLKNVGLLTLGSITTKFLSFFLLPLYTGVLTTTEYGTYDLYVTTVSLLYPILTLCVTNSILRFLLDDNYNKKSVISIGFKYFIISFLILSILLIFNKVFTIIAEVNEYIYYFILIYISTVLNSWLVSVAKGLEKIKDVTISSILSGFFSILLNIVFLLHFKWGLEGYFRANIIGINVANIYFLIVTKTIKYVDLKSINKREDVEIRKYGSGLVLNSVSWWINNSLDKYVVIYMCGIASNGLLSVAYKIPTILSTFQGIFEQAWNISAVKKYDANDADRFFIKTYNAYNFCTIMASSLFICFTKPIAGVLFQKDFYDAWPIVPFLIIAVVFNAEAGFIGQIFTAQKNVRIISTTTFVGAAINIVFNFILIYYLGVIGGALATMFSNFVVFLVRLFFLKKSMKFEIRYYRDMLMYITLVLQAVLLILLENSITIYLTQCILILTEIFLYKYELIFFINKFFKKV